MATLFIIFERVVNPLWSILRADNHACHRFVTLPRLTGQLLRIPRCTCCKACRTPPRNEWTLPRSSGPPSQPPGGMGHLDTAQPRRKRRGKIRILHEGQARGLRRGGKTLCLHARTRRKFHDSHSVKAGLLAQETPQTPNAWRIHCFPERGCFGGRLSWFGEPADRGVETGGQRPPRGSDARTKTRICPAASGIPGLARPACPGSCRTSPPAAAILRRRIARHGGRDRRCTTGADSRVWWSRPACARASGRSAAAAAGAS